MRSTKVFSLPAEVWFVFFGWVFFFFVFFFWFFLVFFGWVFFFFCWWHLFGLCLVFVAPRLPFVEDFPHLRCGAFFYVFLCFACCHFPFFQSTLDLLPEFLSFSLLLTLFVNDSFLDGSR